ncbi:non-ribosomal peptide synthetase [Pseudonocardia sp. P1]
MKVTPPVRLPLSVAQRGVWSAQQLFADSTVYRVGQIIWLSAPVDPDRFVAAIDATVAETEALRVRFEESGGVPMQWVDDTVSVPTEVRAEPLDDAAIIERVRVDYRSGATGEALYAPSSMLVRRAAGGWAWAFTHHHLVLDAYGVALFVRRVAEHYTASHTQGTAPEPWFGRLADAVGDGGVPDTDGEIHWRTLLDVDVDPRGDAGDLADAFSFQPHTATVPLAADVRDRLVAYARAARLSWPDTMVALWGLFTARSRHSDRIAVRMPFMLRGGPALLRTPSMASRIFPVVVGITPAMPLTDVLRATSAQIRGVEKYQGIEDSQLARLWPGGEADYFALPVANVKVLDYEVDFAGTPGIEQTVNPGPVGRLDLSVYNDPVHGFRLDLRGREPSYAGQPLESWAGRFAAFLDTALELGTEVSLAELDRALAVDAPVAPATGTASIEGTELALPATTVDDLVRAEAARSADRVAVVGDTDGTRWTFADLDARVNALAALLVERGVRAGDRVGVLLPRCPDLVVALAAVLRAGAGYLPVDPALPAGRIAAIVTDGGPRLTITDSDGADRVGPDVLLLDDATVAAALHRGRATPPELSRAPTADDPVYVIFTSGTTGRPKGVVVPHRALVSRLAWGRARYPLADGEIVLMKTPVSFDVSAPEVFAPLTEGGTLVVAADERHGDPEYLHDAVRRHGVNRINFVPSMGEEFVRAGSAALPSVTTTMVAGEAFPTTLSAALSTITGGTVLNVYGPTETGEITHHEVDPTAVPAGAVVPIGIPMANTRARVLDSWLREVGPGVPGELYLGGTQLAEGYAGRPGLTAERFVADPGSAVGERLYRTGDLVSHDRFGVLHYLGRADDQIKIRGHRVEPGEVVSALERHPSVTRAIVVAHEHPVAGTRLVGYVTTVGTADGAAGDPDELREHLAALLPGHMVPAAIEVLEAFPVTPNGKIDRRALPEPTGLTAATGRAPGTRTELALAAAFREVLGLPVDTELGVDDDFFALGGHSLLATRVVARVGAAAGVRISLRDVFDRPTVAGLADLLGELPATAPAAPVPAPRPDRIPASAGQRALWLVEQLGGPGGRYVVPTVVRLTGALDEDALESALRDVVTRHEPLRTLLQEHDDQLLQVIVDPAETADRVRVAVEDHVGASRAVVEDRVAAVVRARFDLGADLPVRAVVLRTGAGADPEWRLVLAVHHHAVDEWSLPSLLADLSAAYRARVAGAEPGWAPLPVQYADHTLAELAALGDPDDEGSVLAGHLRYWRDALDGAPDESTISPDRARPAAPTHRGQDVPFALEPSLVTGLHETARARGLTPFMLAQAAVALAVSALGGGDDVVVGSPVGGRTADGVADAVGYFANIVPVRHRIGAADTVADVLARARETVLDGFAHQEAPFEKIVAAAGAARDTGRNPVYQVMLTHQQLTGEPYPLALPGVGVHPDSADIGAVKTDLDVYLTDAPAGIEGFVSAATDLFDRATVERFVAVFTRVLEVVATDPGRAVARLDVLPAASSSEVTTWSLGPDVDAPAATVDGLLREQVRSTPDAPAVLDATVGIRWTFAELDARIDAFAATLTARGVVTGDRVGVLLPRSADLVVVLAGVLRAGAAYVPLDPAHPTAHVARIVEVSRPRLVVSDPATVRVHRAVIDAVPHLVVEGGTVDGRVPAVNGAVAPVLSPHDTAQVIFTSGTTGEPKGVQLSHGAMVNRLGWGAVLLGLDGDAVGLVKSGVGFVDAATELFGPLTAGAAVVVVADEDARDAIGLAAAVRAYGVTHLLTVPGLADTMAGVDDTAFGSLRHWVSSGEALSPGTRDTMHRVAPHAVLHNFYGSTEVTGDATAVRVDPGAELRPGTGGAGVPIGRPQPGVSTRVLDRWLRPVAAGVAGELYVGGVQLADGYLGRAVATAERFVADPFGAPGARLYRTGDLARWNSGGALEYVGRADDQVTIRGHRVEPDRTRAVLREHPAVTGAVVLGREHPAGGTRLLAWVTTAGPDPDLAAELRGFVASRLPEYMVPAAFEVLEEFPLTPNGKIDRRALPVPEAGGATSTGRAPRTDAERLLASAFADVLALPAGTEPGIDDDFFRLGGHSLLATRLVARVGAASGARITLRDVFDRPTVAGLAALVENSTAARPVATLGEIARPAAIPASYGQQSLWFADRMGGPEGRYVVPIVVRLTGTLDEPALQAALRDVVLRHEALRTVLREGDGRLLQEVLDPADVPARVAVAVEDLVGAAPAAVEDRVAAVVRSRFDLASELPVRAVLLRTGAGADPEWRFVVAVHHHAVDEWSLPSLLSDLSAAYRARVAGAEPGWAPLPVQYADHALWQRAHLGRPDDEGSVLAGHLRYWRDALDGAPDESTISSDRPRPVEPTHRGEDVPFALEPSVVDGLREVARAQGVTSFMVSQAAVALAVSALGGGDEVVVGSPVGGRTEEGVAEIVGYFANTLPLRHRIGAADTVADVLARARETVLDGFAHQAAPFDQIVTAIGAQRAADRTPLYQVMLTHLQRSGTEQEPLALPGVRARREPAELGAVKTDLDIYLIDGADGVEGFVSAATDLFDRATVERFVAVFTRVLEVVATDPGRAVARLDVLPAASSSEVTTWSLGPDVDAPATTVDGLLREQVRSTPDAPAVLDATVGIRWTFADLDARIDAIAARVAARGVTVGARVAVLLPRSADQVAVLAGLLRAGAAYVPVDPAHPAAHVARILTTATPALVVTDRATAAAHDLPADRLLLVDEPAAEADRWSGPARPVTPRDTAQVIFTSGTTGEAKGVGLPHGAVADRLRWGNALLELDGTAVCLAKSGAGFVDAVTELFGPLTAGAAVVVVGDGTARDAGALAELIREHHITHLLTVPGLADTLADSRTGSGPGFGSLRHWVSSGEPLTAAGRDAMRRAAPHAVLHNFYGSTEVTGDATAARVDTGDPDRRVAIGRPQPGSSARVLDRWLRPVPAGVAGELYVGGGQLADGYLALPGLTAERFVADPFGHPGSRLYRTGDLARWTAGGELEFLGRADDQVTIRGHRVEPEQVRGVLREHPAVTGAVVLAAERPTGGPQLLAWVTAGGPGPGPGPGPGLAVELREFVASRLPEYMVPAAVTTLAEFPLTPNGKIDRRALPAPDLTEGAGAGGRSPETATERALAEHFREVLRLDGGAGPRAALAVDADFFRLGGDSLLAARLLTRINTTFASALRLRHVFGTPTIAGLAEAVTGVARHDGSPLSPITEVVRPDPVPASYGQQALWLLDELGMGPAYQVGIVLRIPGGADPAALHRGVARFTERHEILRTAFVAGPDGELTQLVRPPDDAPVLAVETVAADAVPARIGALLAQRCDLAADGGAGFTLLRTGGDDLLVVHGHHIVIDEGSVRPLVRDLDVLYDAELSGTAAALPRLLVQSAEFAVWQRSTLGDRDDPDSRFRGELTFWEKALADLPAETPLPLDRPRSETTSRTVRTVRDPLPAADSAAVERLLAERRATPLQGLITALALGLWTEGAGNTVPVGTPVELRDQPELDDAVGYFVNTVVVRAEIDETVGFGTLLSGVRDRVVDAGEHKTAPFDSVVEALGPPRIPGVSPLFQVMAAFLDDTARDPVAGRLVPDPAAVAEATGDRPALFDLVYAIVRRPDGALDLQLNATRELFTADTGARLLAGVRRFLVLGARYPQLPLRHLVELVRAVTDPADLGAAPDGPGARIPLPGFTPDETTSWRAAAEYLRHVVPGAGMLALEVRDDGTGELTGTPTGPDAAALLAGLAGELVESYRSTVAVRLEWPDDTARGTLTGVRPRLRRADRARVSRADARRIRAEHGEDSRLLPLSSLQSGLLYHMVRARETGDHNAYVSQILREIEGEVDPAHLESTTRRVLERYPNLRAAFVTLRDTEVQVIPQRSEVPFRVVRLDPPGGPGRAEFLEAERQEPFDFATGPLIRFTLLEHGPGAWTFAMTFEHILMDGWSINALLGEIVDAYADPGLLDRVRPVSFESYLDWLETRDAAAGDRAWAGYLAEVTEPTLLWPEGGDLGLTRVETGDLHRDLSPAEAATVYAAARRAGVTVGTLLQTAWAVTLGRVTGRGDVVFGNTVSGRPPELPGSDRMIGLLFNTLPMRVRARPDETVTQLLARVRSEQLEVLDHPDVELTRIQNAAGLGALFDTLFVVQNLPFDPFEPETTPVGGLRVTGGTVNDATHYPVTVAVNPWEHDGAATVHVRLSYRRDALDEAAAERLTERYLHVLRALAAGPDTALGRIPGYLPGEDAPSPAGVTRAVPEVTVADLLRAQVARSPQETALVAGDRSYTFDGFSAEVHRYARVLLARGVRPEHRVALLLPRDERMVIAMFAVFAVGAAYVPIDAEHPDERIATMCDIARPTVTLVTGRDAARLPGTAAGQVLDLDEPVLRAEIADAGQGPVTDAERGGPIDPDHLAYIIFTSGSTGLPKGVAVGYRGLTNMYANHVEEIFDRVVAHQGGRRMKIAHTTSFSFDASWEQLFWLLNGHEVHVIDEELRREPQQLLAHYDDARIDGFDVTPSYGQVLVDQGLLDRDRPAGRSVAADAPGVVFVSLGGEAVPDTLWRQLREAPGVESYNLYGPTEYTINALGADLADTATSSVGRPIFNSRVYILDDNLQPALPGVPGELYLAGAGTARGYWGQPGRTAERFVACPWEPGTRMYRTGDLARWTPGGTIDYLGRADDQVKIRGYRIEPSEVADTLAGDPQVARAAVIARADARGALQLYGYLVPAADGPGTVDLDAVRARARTLLPDYMVPAGLAALDDLPLTVNGKIETKALPVIESAAAEYVAPASGTEVVVAGAVAELLGTREVSVSANFFDVGGNSLLAMRLVARLNERLGSELLVSDVFAAQVLGTLAAVADDRSAPSTSEDVAGDVAGAVLVPLRAAAAGRHLFCAHARYGHASLYSALGRYLPDGVGLVGLQDPAHAGLGAEFGSMAELATVYADAVQRVQPHGPYDLLGWSFGGHIVVAVGRELVGRGERIGSVTIVDTTPTGPDHAPEPGDVLPRPGVPVAEDEQRQREFLDVNSAELRALLGPEVSAELSAEALTAFAVAGLRCERHMAERTVGELDAPALLVAAGAPVEADRAAGTGIAAWGAHLPGARTEYVDGEDHHSIIDPDRGLPRWADHLTGLLEGGTAGTTHEERKR